MNGEGIRERTAPPARSRAMSLHTLARVATLTIPLAGCSAPASDEMPQAEAASPTPAAPPAEPVPAPSASDAGSPAPHVGPGPEPGTRILDQTAAERLLGASGITLQWIDWNQHGPITVSQAPDGTIRISGSQDQQGGPGRLFVEGDVREIGADYFIFDGLVRITETPDDGRSCEADKPWYFAITQNRPYWRLREFEWCDDLTDYVDIHF